MPAFRLRRITSVVVALALGVASLLVATTFAAPAHAAAPTITEIGATSGGGTGKQHTVTVPAKVKAGDRLVLFLTANAKSGLSGPSGWSALQTRKGKGLTARAWTRKATAADHGRRLRIRTTKSVRTALAVVAYRSTGTGATVTTSRINGSNAARRSLTTPAVSVRDTGSWLVSAWTAASQGNPSWKLPGSSPRRVLRSTTGKSRVSIVVGDSRRAVATGQVPGRKATTKKKIAGSAGFSVVVSPGQRPNTAPQADFAANCDELVCAFDASTSADADGDSLAYTWDFGDGAKGSGVTSEHTYAGAGSRTVKLTVKDGTASTTASKTVSAAPLPSPTDSARQPVPGHQSLAPEDATPPSAMPTIDEGEIWDIETVGDRVFVAGTFTAITDSAGDGDVIDQASLAAYDLQTGLVDRDFDPQFTGGDTDSTVKAVEASPDGSTLYVAGSFNAVNGVSKRKIAALDVATGEPDAGFTADANSVATALDATDTTVYVGGRFAKVNGIDRTGLVALDGTTGGVDLEFDNQLSGGIGTNGQITVQQLRLTHDNSKLVVVHTARKIDGQDRYGIGIIGTSSKQLLPWRTRLWEDNLQYVGGIQRIYGGDVAPDDSYFVVTGASGGDRPPINDTAVAFRFGGGDRRQPIWISRAFDSIYSVAITEKAVYIGGHFQWNESPTAPDPWPGLDDVGYGTGQGLSAYALGDAVVRRDHLGALNPADGKALEWHPGSNSIEGNKAMLATPHGLITGGDARRQGGQAVGRMALFDLDRGAAPDTRIGTPIQGRVVPAGQQVTIEGTAPSSGLRRVQVEIASGNQFLAEDGTWSSDFAGIDARLGSTAGGRVSWSLPVTVPDAREITLRTKAFYSDGSTDPAKATKKIESFSFDDLPPTTRISEPGGSVQASTSFLVRGTATDDKGVSSVTLYVRDLDTNRFLTADGDLVDGYTTFRIEPDDPGAVSTSWQHQVDLPYEGRWKVGALASDTSGQSDTRWDTRDYTVDSSAQAPTVAITQPVAVTPPVTSPTFTLPPGGPLTFRGTANDDGPLASVEVSLRNNTTREALAADGTWGSDVIAGSYKISPANLNTSSYSWSYTMPANLTPGSYSFSVRATDQSGLATAFNMSGRLTFNVAVTGDVAPDGTVDVPSSPVLTQPRVDVSGSATDDKGVNQVRVAILEADSDRYLRANGSLEPGFGTVNATVATPGGTNTRWNLSAALPTGGEYRVTAYAVDTAGQLDPSPGSATYRYYPGDAAPSLVPTLASPTDGTAFTDSRIFVSGRAEDDISIAEVEVAVVNAAGQYLSSNGSFGTSERWNSAFLNSPGSLGSNYSYTTPIVPDGTYQVRVRPVDNHGQVPEPREVNVSVSAPAGNAAPVAIGSVSCAANLCTFDGRASTDENKPTLTYSWSYGNGRSGSGALPTFRYTSPGTFTPTLTVRDEYGLTHTVTLDPITVTEPAGNRAPTAVYTTPTCVGLVCSFSGASSTDPDTGDTLSYAWDFGDGTTSTSSSPANKAFPAGGTYPVTLTVTDGWGKADTVTRSVTVQP